MTVAEFEPIVAGLLESFYEILELGPIDKETRGRGCAFITLIRKAFQKLDKTLGRPKNTFAITTYLTGNSNVRKRGQKSGAKVSREPLGGKSCEKALESHHQLADKVAFHRSESEFLTMGTKQICNPIDLYNFND